MTKMLTLTLVTTKVATLVLTILRGHVHQVALVKGQQLESKGIADNVENGDTKEKTVGTKTYDAYWMALRKKRKRPKRLRYLKKSKA